MSDFLNSMGVNIHMSYNKTRYGNADATVQALQQLGITHVRENFKPNNSGELSRLKTLSAAGIRFDFVVPRPDEKYGDDPSTTTDPVAKNFAANTDAFEGPNEYDSTSQSDWVARLRSAQHKLAPAAASNADLSRATVYGPSLLNYKLSKDAPTVGDLSDALQYGNVHSYPGGQMPETEVESQMGIYQRYISAGKSVVATETGYHNATHNSHKNGHPSTTERTAALYFPRMFLEYFRAGVSRTYSYELFDEGTSANQEDHFGLFTPDGSAKPAAQAIGNLTSILADKGDAANAPSTLAYTVTDPSASNNNGTATSNVRRVLLQKSDGTFYLALWRAVSEAIPGKGSSAPRDLSPQAQPVNVTFNQPVASADTYLPSVGTGSQSQYQDPKSINIPIGGDVTLVKIATPDAPGGSMGPGGSGGSGGSAAPTASPAPATPTPTASASPSGTDGDTGSGGNGAGNGTGNGTQPTPEPSPSSSAPAGELPILTLPPLGTTNPVPVSLSSPHQLLAPATAVPLASRTFEVDGKPLTSNVLIPADLSAGRHVVRVVGRMPGGQQVVSAQLVSVVRPASSHTALFGLAAALLIVQASAIWGVWRRRPVTATA